MSDRQHPTQRAQDAELRDEALVRAIYEAWGCCANAQDAVAYVLARLEEAR